MQIRVIRGNKKDAKVRAFGPRSVASAKTADVGPADVLTGRVTGLEVVVAESLRLAVDHTMES